MKKSQALAVVTETPSVTDAIQALNSEIKGLHHITESVYVTSGKLTLANGSMDIKTETKEFNLVQAMASVVSRTEAIEKGYAALGITEYSVVKIDGSTAEEWKKDITLRMQIIRHKDRLDELNAMKKEWEELMDKEDRKLLLAKKMQKALGKA